MSPAARAAKPRESHHAGLDRERVVDCAAAMVESGGPEALTMRKLAGELGVTPTTLYWHVGSRDDIVTAIIERQGERQAARAIQGATSVERVTDAARSVWTSALENRQVTRLAYQSGATSLLELGLEVALVRELEAAGLVGVEARDALRSILTCLGGFLVLALRDPDAVPAERSSTELWAGLIDHGIDPETLAALGQPVDLELLFENTIGAVITHWVGRS